MVLEPDILDRIRSDYAADEVATAIAAVSVYSGPEASRVLRCVLYLSGGALAKLTHFLEVAHTDYRDVIAFAEYDRSGRRVRDFTGGFPRE
jgi:hypothetical protein